MKEKFLLPSDVFQPPVVPLRDVSDRAFEIAVFETAKAAIAKIDGDDHQAKAELTPPSADRGRDVVISDYKPSHLFGIELGKAGTPKKLFIECKMTSKKRLTLEHVAANVLQIEPEPDSVFMLVTNATLTPRAACVIERQCARLGVDFLLIDAWNFGKCLNIKLFR